MVWVVFGVCVLALLVIFATTTKGTASIVLGMLMFGSAIEALDPATPMASVLGFAFATVALLWGLSYKLEARYLHARDE